jgi:hypothetical protein
MWSVLGLLFRMRTVLACMVGMSFVVEIFSVGLDDCPVDVPRFRLPRHVIADLESLPHHEPAVAVSAPSRVEAEPWTA